MATTPGNKVGIRKRRQNDNGTKKDKMTVTKKASAQDASQSLSKGNENDKEVNPRKKRLFNVCF